MTRHPMFLTYGLVLLAFVSFANFRGMSPWGVSVANAIPKAISNNPGANRSVYGGGSGRYSGGK